MTLRTKLLLVAILPLIASFVSISFVLRQQQSNLSNRQQVLVRQSYTDAAQTELRHYVALALSTISPLYNTGRDDAQIQQEAMRRLAQLNYGPDGYFFLYDFDGTNLMHPRQPELVGRNLLELRDARGQPAIRMMIDKARSGGGFVNYTWNKPSTHSEAPKLAYVTGLLVAGLLRTELPLASRLAFVAAAATMHLGYGIGTWQAILSGRWRR